MSIIEGLKGRIFYVKTNEDLAILVSLLQGLEIVVVDTESYPDKKYGNKASGLDPQTAILRLIQVNWVGNETPFVVDLMYVDGSTLVDALNRDNLIKVIHNAQHDLKMIYAAFGVWLRNVYCSMTASRTLAVSTGWRVARMRGHSLKAISRDYADVILDKDEQLSDWSSPNLSISQISYAASDVDEYLIHIMTSIRDALISPMPIGYEEETAFNLDQDSIQPISRIEYEGMFINKELLSLLIRESERLMEIHRENLCAALDLPIEKEIGIDENGELVLNTVIPYKVSKLLNNNKELVNYINRAISKTGTSLTSLQAEELEESLSKLEDDNPGEDEDPYQEKQYYDFGIDLIKELLNYKKYVKLLSDVKKYDSATNVKTGRLYSNFNIVGAGTGRMSSSSDSGVNLQQISKFGMVANVPYQTMGIDKEGEFKTYISLRHAFNHPEGHCVAVCIPEDGLINTSRGLRRADTIKVGDTLITDGGPGRVSHLKETPNRKVLKLTTRLGYEVEATPGHEFMTVENGSITYKQMRQLKAGGWVVLHRNWGSPIQSNYLIDGKPLELNEAYKRGYELEDRITHGVYQRVPLEIMQSSQEIQCAFLSGLFTRNGFIEKTGRARYVALINHCYEFITDVHILLISLGIVSRKRTKSREKTNLSVTEFWVCISEYDEVCLFRDRIGFRDEFKKDLLDEVLSRDAKPGHHCLVPADLVLASYKGKPLKSDLIREMIRTCKSGRHVTKSYLKKSYLDNPDAFHPEVRSLIYGDLLFEKIECIENEGRVCTVYDFTIPKLKRFTVNGVIVHNCDYSGSC